jgi:hypothetical protein
MSEEVFKLGLAWAESFNALDDHTRTIGVAMEIKVRLQHLQFERDRLKKAYDRSLFEIRQHERNLVDSLKRLGNPSGSPSTT